MIDDPKELLAGSRASGNADLEEQVDKFLKLSRNDRDELVFRCLWVLTHRFLAVERSVRPEDVAAASRPGPTLQ